MKDWPTVSILIPTLNASKILGSCLKRIRNQTYPQSKIKVIIADGGSTDKTIAIAKKYHCLVVSNKLKTAEAGKAVALAHASGEYIALIDSDNLLPSKRWLKDMILPLINDPKLIGSEPIRFTYRPHAGFIERYSALTGVNDPYSFYSGIYDRFSYLSGTWTGLNLPTVNRGTYIEVELNKSYLIPTIGANGTIFRASFLKSANINEYLFDIDVISHYLQSSSQPVYFAKTKNSIIHTYCESSISKFIRKQQRRINDYYFYQKFRHFDWNQTNKTSIYKYSLMSFIPVIPLIHSIIGYFKKPDIAWFFHPLACFLSFYIYALSSVKYKLGLIKPVDRTLWSQ